MLAPAQVVKVEDLPLEMRQELDAGSCRAIGSDAAAAAPVPVPAAAHRGGWRLDRSSLIAEVERRLQAVCPTSWIRWRAISRRRSFARRSKHTHGRRIDAATRLGVGRNTITRKIQELQLED